MVRNREWEGVRGREQGWGRGRGQERERGRGGAVRRATCAGEDRVDFPIDARIHRGPAIYRPGGGHEDWTVDLTNATDEPCGNIHPVLVLVDEERTLTSRQVRLRFVDGTRWRPVAFERTGQGEHVGVFDDGFPGFTVAPGRTLTVKVRLAFTADAGPNHVVASAAVVQRRDGDGDWVGASNDYPFDLAPGASAELAAEPPAGLRAELAETGSDVPLVTRIAAAGAVVLVGSGTLALWGARRPRVRRR
ncbi:hypothetical protein AB0H82_00770 [Streptomyces sp. NPDC050732]|uniref:hypothetical protein n=1 Tax=Streptomyces sp. NPDC050732 TaxID=3154632 RepID=UPI00342FFD48